MVIVAHFETAYMYRIETSLNVVLVHAVNVFRMKNICYSNLLVTPSGNIGIAIQRHRGQRGGPFSPSSH